MQKLTTLFKRFRKDRRASIAVMMSLSMIPATGIVGAAVDYGRALRTATILQTAVDTATLSGAILTVQDRKAVAQAAFAAALAKEATAFSASATFSTLDDPSLGTLFSGVATANLSSTFMRVLGFTALTITKKSRAQFGTGDNSCILTLGGQLNLDDETLTFNGSPNINLNGCTVRSNKSIKCNGHNTGAIASVAAGNVINCPNPMPSAGIVPDIYAKTAQHIKAKCGVQSGSVTWDTSGIPFGPNVLTVARTGYREIHICGDLNISGTGILGGSNSTQDLVIVVENGDINVTKNAGIQALRTTFVLGVGSGAGQLKFPNGNGHSAKLFVSSSIAHLSPWAGIAIYQDPRPPAIVSTSWGPGAALTIDGINYLPRTELVLGGIASTGPSNCSKLISYSFRINGAVSLKQNASGCANMLVTQFSGPSPPAALETFIVSWKHFKTLDSCFTRFLHVNRQPLHS